MKPVLKEAWSCSLTGVTAPWGLAKALGGERDEGAEQGGLRDKPRGMPTFRGQARWEAESRDRGASVQRRATEASCLQDPRTEGFFKEAVQKAEMEASCAYHEKQMCGDLYRFKNRLQWVDERTGVEKA